MVSQSDQIKACYKEMKQELKTFKQEVTYREYIGFELAINRFYERFKRIIDK